MIDNRAFLQKESKGHRIASVDYGKKRLGYAVCDEFHISITPKKVFNPDEENFLNKFIEQLKLDKIRILVVGFPFRQDSKQTEIMNDIQDFINTLKEKTEIIIVPFDESFSSIRASKIMVEIGKKKKNRAKKGSLDLVAAGIILQDFLNEIE